MATELKVKKERCNELLRAMVGEHLVSKWWKSPNKAFEMRTPNEQWNISHEEVCRYLLNHAGGYR